MTGRPGQANGNKSKSSTATKIKCDWPAANMSFTVCMFTSVLRVLHHASQRASYKCAARIAKVS